MRISFFELLIFIRKNIFACLFSVHNTISLSLHEQVCLMSLIKHTCSWRDKLIVLLIFSLDKSIGKAVIFKPLPDVFLSSFIGDDDDDDDDDDNNDVVDDDDHQMVYKIHH